MFIDASKLATGLKNRVIGQDAVCDDIAAQVRRRLALKQRDKPVGVFMLAGPPGTGKTYLAKCLSAALNRKLLHFDMTQLSSGGHGATQLFGSSKGYVGSDSYGKLTAGLRDSPDAVVLLDEFEKAHPDVHKNFLTAWNDGFVTEASDGKHISTSRAIFVLTTNAATEVLHELAGKYAACWTIRTIYATGWSRWGDRAVKLSAIDRAAAGDMSATGITYPQDFISVQFTRTEAWGLLEVMYLFSPEVEHITSHTVLSINESDWTPANLSRYPEKVAYIDKMKAWGKAFWPQFKQAFDGGAQPGKWSGQVATCCRRGKARAVWE